MEGVESSGEGELGTKLRRRKEGLLQYIARLLNNRGSPPNYMKCSPPPTLFVHPGCLHKVCPPQLSSNQRNVNVAMRNGAGLLLEVRVRGGDGSRKLVRRLREEAVDEPLARFTECVNEVVLWRRVRKGGVKKTAHDFKVMALIASFPGLPFHINVRAKAW